MAANKWALLLALTMLLPLAFSLRALSEMPISVISAAPALLPFEPPLSAPPATSPVLSPDISPLFPTPAGSSPTESSLPVIPSSPSPPNPDEMIAPGPTMAFPPDGLLPDSSAFSVNAFTCSSLVIILLLHMGLVPLSG